MWSDKMMCGALIAIMDVRTEVIVHTTTTGQTDDLIVTDKGIEDRVLTLTETSNPDKMNKLRYILLCLPLLLASCQRDIVSSAHENIDACGWAMTDTIRLPLTVVDTAQVYDLALILRHTDQYVYQNLWVFVQSADSLCPLSSDTVMACLADDRGQWLGSRAGRYYAGYVIMERNMSFPAAGTYTFALVHGMRDSIIPGIADIGLELRKNHGKE